MNLWLKFLIVILIFLLLLILIVGNYIGIYRYMTINDNDIYRLDREYYHKKKIKNCIISLTTTPNRLKEIKPCLLSLLDSSVAVEEIRLNIPYKSSKGIKYEIPKWLMKLKSIKIHRVEKDWGPATKLLPTLLDYSQKQYQNTKIIVVDDDVIYGYYMTETINQYYEKYNTLNKLTRKRKQVAITMYGDEIADNNSMKYDLTTRAKNYIAGETYTDVLRGHSAYLVTPSMFTKDIYDYTKHPSECFFVDDNYFSFHLKKNKVRILMAGLAYKAVPLPDLVNCAIDGLHAHHNGNGRNEKIVNKHFRKRV